MIIAKLEPREYYSKNEVDCLPTCIRALLDTFDLGNLYYKIIKNLSVTKYGYDFIEVAAKLAESRILAEVGLYDNDYIPKLKNGVQLNYDDLTALRREKRNMPKHAFESLAEIRQFAKKYPGLIKIQKTDFKVIESWLKRGLPVCLFVDLALLTRGDDDRIHALILYAYDSLKSEIYVWDPALEFRVHEKKILIDSWKLAGGYYLVMNHWEEPTMIDSSQR